MPAEELARPEAERKESAVSRVVRKILPFGAPDIVVVGHNDLLATLAKCCNPVPGEKIIGLHHAGPGRLGPLARAAPTCENLLYDPERQIDVAWAGEKKASYAIELEVVDGGPAGPARRRDAGDRGRGLQHPPDRGARRTRRARRFVSVSLETSDLKQLEKILAASAASRACAT